MTPAEFFVLAYDFFEAQERLTEAYKKRDKEPKTYQETQTEFNAIRDKFRTELHRCDDKTQKTYYLLAKEKLQRINAMNELKETLGAEKL